MPSEDKVFDMYGYSGQANGDYLDFESHRPMNLLYRNTCIKNPPPQLAN
jgi:hypothetical protein